MPGDVGVTGGGRGTRGPGGGSQGPEAGERGGTSGADGPPDEGILTLLAPAKVNLFLRVLAREEGGYHQLETLFQLLELSDRLSIERTARSGVELEVQGATLGPPEENLAWRAATALLEAAGGPGRSAGGVRIVLEKRIPHGAGLGGGSSDAAAVLRGVNRLLGLALPPERLLALGASLGSDVPVFLSPSTTTLAWGRGDRMLPLPPLPRTSILLALPDFPVSTPEAYRWMAEWRGRGAEGGGNGGPALLDPGGLRTWEGVAAASENDFEGPVFAMHPHLGEICEGIRRSGAVAARLSGSGSALFGVFIHEAGAAAAGIALGQTFPSVRFVVTRSLATP